MEKEEIITKLKNNHYSVEEKENQIIVNLTRKCHFIIALHNEQMINYKEIIRSTVRFRKDVSLKSEVKNAIIGIAGMLFLSVVYKYIMDISFMEFNPFFVITIAGFFESFILILYYYKHFARVKKVLNIS